ncbi:DUF1592 domain-containing protein [Aporhodopirellula aestuarii]|uniref:DUF1592 domain-containing protein n=1 Tax=Aporhodopirellula aestuarii TaxID=2950107 RepID=A0ABT0UAU6_9BACT|nr:DUF1592 domain-containing protein [Aporhodopirellula aestuarii]MCM2373645.1 DUF1592 domain-containing protein [Aporhodopirellula aestuarii]
MTFHPHTHGKHAGLFVLAVLLGPLSLSNASEVPRVLMDERHRALLVEHCQGCHGGENAEANFRVDDLSFEIADLQMAARWQKVLGALNSGEMPPEGEEPLSVDAKTNFLDDLANLMVAARKSLGDQKGVITMRRLNRREYRNTLRELLGVEINVTELPADTGSGRYDTVGSNLFMSSTQFEQYMSLGREALEETFAREISAAEKRVVRLEAEQVTQKVADYIEWQIDAKDRATRWMKLVDEATEHPENAAIVEEIRAGPLGKHRHTIYRQWQLFPGVPAPETFGFNTVENNADKAIAALSQYHHRYHHYYMQQPAVDTGAYLAIPNEHPSVLDNASINLLIPYGWPLGEYIVRFRAAITDNATPDRQFIEFGTYPAAQQPISAHHITATMDNPQIVEIPFTLTRGHRNHNDRVLFLREKGVRDDYAHTTRIAKAAREANDDIGRTFSLWVDWLEIERVPNVAESKPPGVAALRSLPLDDRSGPPAANDVRAALTRFAREAFRGQEPPSDYVDKLTGIYLVSREAGTKHSVAIKETLAIILASPMFLYLAEPDAEETRRPLTQHELATRLSYFLWGAPPDSRLRELAEQDHLADREVLVHETMRLLDDPRSHDFVTGFVSQWLSLDRFDFFQVNLDRHPRFDNATRISAKKEVFETVAFLLKNNGSLSDLLKSNYVVVDGLMANYYGLEDVAGDEFRPVKLSADSPRGGLLGMAAIHLMGSNGDDTSPVERGAWVLRKLLNDPPPPAPPNIPQLARLAGQVLTTQERLVAHQEEPQCASCHRKIDPIGFGLENFDAVGAWRTEDHFQVTDENGKPDPNLHKTWKIDAAAKLHSGESFNNYFELRDMIASKSDDFARGFTENLIEYALGRPVGFSDEALVEHVFAQSREEQFALRTFLRELVSSKEFQTR